jgi:hypothetical protein
MREANVVRSYVRELTGTYELADLTETTMDTRSALVYSG